MKAEHYFWNWFCGRCEYDWSAHRSPSDSPCPRCGYTEPFLFEPLPGTLLLKKHPTEAYTFQTEGTHLYWMAAYGAEGGWCHRDYMRAAHVVVTTLGLVLGHE